jgi:hypothetical protein
VTLTLPASDTALIRREQLLRAHPGLRISAGTGYWQAVAVATRLDDHHQVRAGPSGRAPSDMIQSES